MSDISEYLTRKEKIDPLLIEQGGCLLSNPRITTAEYAEIYNCTIKLLKGI